ncbi:MAG: SiaB family protein kinase [Bacteroidales bacterium]|nr:SiaB family protein kinase [Bacteroidales bacterium]
MISKLKKIYKDVKSEGDEVIVDYFGLVEEKKLEEILNDLEKKTTIFSNKIKRRIFLITVEMLQNLYHHSVPDNTDNNEFDTCFFAITSSKNNTIFKFTSGNFINQHNLSNLEAKIEQLNQLSDDEIRTLYKNVLGNNEFSKKGGGGLGIIDIKRKSGLPLNFNKINFNKNLYFFNFIVFLENKN